MKLSTKALLPITAAGALALLLAAASGPQTVVNNAAPFALLSDRQLQTANVSLLARLMGLPLTSSGVANILSNAAPFQTLSDRNIVVMQTYLLYQLTGAATNVPVSDGAFTNIWLYSDIVNGNDGSTVLSVTPGAGRALYDENSNDAIDFYFSPADHLGYALNDSSGAISLAWDVKLLAGNWFANSQLKITNSSGSIQLLSGNIAASGTLSLTGAVLTLQANKSALVVSNIAVSPYLWTNTFGYNVVVYISGAGGGSNSIAQNGTFIGYMTNGCTLICQPNEYVWNTNGAAHPNFSIKPF